MINDEFTFENDKNFEETIKIDSSDFKFVQEHAKISDQKFQTKPTTFFKDAIRRFAKNKSSVVAAIILGILILMSLIIPAAVPYDINNAHPSEIKLAPKLFDAGTGFLDGTKSYSNIVYDSVNDKPSGDFKVQAVSKMTHTNEGENFTDSVNTYAYGGYIRLWSSKAEGDVSDEYSELASYYYAYDFSRANYKLDIDVGALPSDSFTSQGEYAVYFKYLEDGNYVYAPLTSYMDKGDQKISININEKLLAAGVTKQTFVTSEKASLTIRLKASSSISPSVLIDQFVISSDRGAEKEELASISCTDANASLSIVKFSGDSENKYYWTITNGQMNLYHANILYCSFVYDTYEAAYGIFSNRLGKSDVLSYVNKGWMEIDFDTYLNSNRTESDLAAFIASFKILNDEKCPIRSIDSISVKSVPGIDPVVDVICGCSQYRLLGYSSMPRFIMGTNDQGKDFFKVVFTGLRTSLLLGVITSAVCFLFGLFWGSIAGYFGGWTDILMERFTDVLSGMPWIVVMTLIIILMGSNFLSFAIALCLTGWIGTSSITRTQFYRFKRREYILAARTLGASDSRLIFRHILPNAVGTIITSSVLMIPSVIFEEATISYLGLGLKSGLSLGIVLSENQQYITTLPYLIVFPSVIMALIMISFNLFGNGLRDAFNPSLKGQD